MKWFKHDVDSSEDVKILRLEEKFGLEGYAIFFKLLEIIGKEGVKGSLSFEKYPKKLISRRIGVEIKKLEEVLSYMGDVKLCCCKSLGKDKLYFSNFKKRSDDYTKRVLRKSERGTDNVPLEKKRIEEIRTEEKRIERKTINEVVDFFVLKKGYDTTQFSNNDWVRIQTGARNLLLRTNRDVEKALDAVSWVGLQGYEWTIETVLKKYPDFEKQAKSPELKELERQLEEM